MEPAAAAAVLVRALRSPGADGARVLNKPLTVADASVASGLAARDAEAGLNWLTSEYRGHLRVTEDGDLVRLFPFGFSKPWETKERFERFLEAAGRSVVGAGRFVVRAWLLVVMVGYALLFVALLIGLTLARQGSNDRDQSPAFGILGGLFRMIADALFWTFHPFSPLYVGSYGASGFERREQRRDRDEIPFYEKVNRFVFGPTTPATDPHVARAAILREIRAQKGRIALADVMRVTGLPRDQADPLMARLMLDHEGDVDVAEGGGIFYRFPSLRRTAERDPAATGPSPSAWDTPPELPPLTGNTAGANVAVSLLNGFNLLASAWVLEHGLTLHNLTLLFARHRPPFPSGVPGWQADSVPLALGLVPLSFSLLLFLLPVVRALGRTRTARRLADERARLAVLREVVTHAAKKEPVSDAALRTAVRVATGAEPTSQEITRRVVELGGDVDLEQAGPDGQVRYRFAGLEADAEAVQEERERAEEQTEQEARLGRVVFASDASEG
jgi:hypothetical protein